MLSNVKQEQLKQVISEVWFNLLELKTKDTEKIEKLETRSCYSSYVNITGVFNGGIFVQTTANHLRFMAANIFIKDPKEVKKGEIKDIIGELSNLIGGHIKGLISEQCDLSLPHVMDANKHLVLSDKNIIQTVFMQSKNQPIKVVLFRHS